jgi:hypothetical protein
LWQEFKGEATQGKPDVSTAVTMSCPGREAIQDLDPKLKMFFPINIYV